jgi:uncharacterized lipoprotein YddW (UPF0748 family)
MVRHATALAGSLLCLLLVLAQPLAGQEPAPPDGQYRGFWVDTFNTTLNNHADVVAVVERARAANANALFAQVRRRGDAWYLNSLEPLPDGVPIAPGFDPLADLIAEAHAASLEVHAFVIVGAIYNRHPVILGLPSSPDHVFNRHGGFNPATGRIDQGPDNWLTRTLLPDGGTITFQGHRIGSEFWIDLGHPDAAADTAEVLQHLVENYDVDGLHLDRIRYPELGVSGQTPTTGANIGYNETSLARFQRHHGIAAGSPPPAPGDPLWSQWRRDQVTNLVRRVYLNAIASRPELKLSASLIVFGGGPTTEAAWTNAEAYWRVYQDWRAWTEEGILDIAMPMNYKAEHSATGPTQLDQWNEWTKNHAYSRSTIIGLGAFLNGVEGSLRQTRRALLPSAAGNTSAGITFFSMATSNRALDATQPVGNRTNPFAFPPGPTGVRPFAEFASALVTGKSVDGTLPYEDPIANPEPFFRDPAPIPSMPWKVNPQVGHLMGFVRDETGSVVDTGAVAVNRTEGTASVGRSTIATATDGGGFYGGVDLAPGTYQVTVTPKGQPAWVAACTKEVTTGAVARLDLVIDRNLPATGVSASPALLWPPNHQSVPVTVSGTAVDQGTGLASIAVRIIDEYGRVEPVVDPITTGGGSSLDWSVSFDLEASRNGEDEDGRTYTIEVTVTDLACNVSVSRTTVLVPHDRGR